MLLLWLIGRLAAGQLTEESLKEAELDLKLLMQRNRLGGSVHVALPFVCLGTGPELWRVEDSNGNDVATMPQVTRRARCSCAKQTRLPFQAKRSTGSAD